MISSVSNIDSLNLVSSLMNSCNCDSSNGDIFDMVMVSLLKSISDKNRNINNYQQKNNLNNNINNLENLNNIQNSIKIESTNKDKTINERIDSAINISSEKYGVDKNLIRAIIKVESNFNPNTVSKSGAKGLMQLMPENCKDLGINDPFDIEQNIDGGTRHIKEYLDKYNGDVEMALMAYNGGPTRMSRRGVRSIDDIYKMPKETQNYVPKVIKYYKG